MSTKGVIIKVFTPQEQALYRQYCSRRSAKLPVTPEMREAKRKYSAIYKVIYESYGAD